MAATAKSINFVPAPPLSSPPISKCSSTISLRPSTPSDGEAPDPDADADAVSDAETASPSRSPLLSPAASPIATSTLERGRTRGLHVDKADKANKAIRKTVSHDNVPRLAALDVGVSVSVDSLAAAAAASLPSPDGDETPDADALRSNGQPAAKIEWRNAARDLQLDLDLDPTKRPSPGLRTVSTPPTIRLSPAFAPPPPPPPPPTASSPPPTASSPPPTASSPRSPSPMPPLIPLPPMSLPTHLHLELASHPPSPLYIHQSPSNSTSLAYESNAIKLERLKNMLLVPPLLERTLYFGALACLDAWLHTFTILPIRFSIALAVLVRWWLYVVVREAKWLVGFVWYGLGRLWKRARSSSSSVSEDLLDVSDTTGRSRSCSRAASEASNNNNNNNYNDDGTTSSGAQAAHPSARARVDSRVRPAPAHDSGPRKSGTHFRHRRTRSMPSNLSTFHKADLLQGAVIICSSLVLMRLDASRMYHLIRAQSAIKLYVVYNILEVGDRLLSALGQDILECLFSAETLSRNRRGRSKILLPLAMFVLALGYSCLHSVALYIQVITLNVAVNSYSNALLTLLLSNQFVEIKSTVFKRFERDNLFQLTCADIVERFQLWVMLLIIGMRNIVEVGGLSIPSLNSEGFRDGSGSGSGFGFGSGSPSSTAPMHPPSILPHSFTVLPSWIMSGEVLSPFLIVVGSEMLVDTIKHAYVTKFNNVKPAFYARILDILCKDYYTNAFSAPSLTRRLGLAVIPLSCLFIRASIQTYHMLVSAHVPSPFPASASTSTSSAHSALGPDDAAAAPSSPAMTAALNRFDVLIRSSLGRATYGYPYGSPLNSRPWWSWTSDDVIAALTMVVVFFILFLVLLILKLLLGMALLSYSRDRYAKMKAKEALVAAGKAEWDIYIGRGARTGGFGAVEVGEDRSRWVNADPDEGLKRRRDDHRPKGPKGPPEGSEKQGDYQGTSRFEMVAKRIW